MGKHGRSPHAPSLHAFVLLASCCCAVAACGGETATTDCVPSCEAGTHCSAGECVPDDPGAKVDLTAVAVDMAMTCAQTCVAPTPHCGPNHQCVVCLEDSHCPPGMVCKSTGAANFCLPGCTDDSRCGAPGGPMKCCGG